MHHRAQERFQPGLFQWVVFSEDLTGPSLWSEFDDVFARSAPDAIAAAVEAAELAVPLPRLIALPASRPDLFPDSDGHLSIDALRINGFSI